MRRWPRQCAPHFLFDLAEKKTGRARSKRKERLAPNLRVRASWLKHGGCPESVPTKPGQSPTGSRRTWAFAPLCPRDFQSGADLGGVTGKPALLAPLTLPGCARVAPAEREAGGIREFPGPKDSPRETRLMKPKRGKTNHPPPAAGGTRLRGPTRRSDFFSWTVHGPFSFCQEQKENGGWNVAAIAASSGRPQVAPTLPPGRVHLLGHHHG